MNPEKARAILAQARTDGTYEGPMPEDDAKAIEEANGLVEMAQAAWDQMVRGPEVEALLRLNNETFDGTNDPAPAADPAPQPEAEAPAEEPTPAPADPAPAEEPQADGPDLSQIEPWEGYGSDKVGDIIAGLDAAVSDYDESELVDLLSNVWQYEAAHKNRAGVISHLEGIHKNLTSSDDDPQPEADAPADEQPAADAAPAPDPEPEPEPQAEEPPPAEPDAEPASEPAPEPEVAPEPEPAPAEAQVDDDHAKLVEVVEGEIRRERAHIPPPPEEDVPDLPWDWTKLSDPELQKFYGIYSSLMYHKGYLLSRDERIAKHYKDAADELHRELLVAADKYDENGKQKTVSLLEAEIEDDENVKKFRRRQRKHETFAANHRNERDSLSKLVESLSRLHTMRQDEWERSGKKK